MTLNDFNPSIHQTLEIDMSIPLTERNKIATYLEKMCLPGLIELCDSAGLTRAQKSVVIERCNRGVSVEQCVENLGMCETCIKKFYRIALERLYDYENYLAKRK